MDRTNKTRIRLGPMSLVVLMAVFLAGAGADAESDCEVVAVDLGELWGKGFHEQANIAFERELSAHPECRVVAVDYGYEITMRPAHGDRTYRIRERLLYDRQEKVVIRLRSQSDGHRSWKLWRNVEPEQVGAWPDRRKNLIEYESSSQLARSRLRQWYEGPEGAIVWH